jgi:predicted glycogen debranching enzyme
MMFSDYHEGTAKEWLITNGLGGYASSTVIGTNTRKYHGLLVASMNPPVERVVLLSSLDEELYTEDGVHKLAVHRYPGTIYPNGNEYLKSFSVKTMPDFLYNACGLIIRKRILMLNGENTTIVKYDIENPKKKQAFLKILPLVNSRSIHHLTKASHIFFTQESEKNNTLIKTSNLQFGLISDMQYQADEHWYYDFEYEVELSRGYPYHEDNFNPGYFELEINEKHCSCFVIASTESAESLKRTDLRTIDELISKEEKRIRDIANKGENDSFLQKLLIAGDSFIVNRKSTGARSIIAGYHWFGDWGRDTMISLPGLTLVTGRFDDAKSILSTFSSNCRRGLIPNLFPENPADSPVYNTVDASLWFVHAAGRYLDYTGDLEFIGKIWPTIMEIIDNYRNGTDYEIRMDDDGLIEHSGQLTWMDAKIGNWEVTPRKGKACEINALWYNALVYAAEMGEKLGRDVSGLRTTAGITAESFREKFHYIEKNCLYDCISGHGENWKDASIRPNQVFAVSLTHTMLPYELEKGIVDIVTEELLTPFGLRTLSPADSRYTGFYRGTTEERDAAYHNGTVWPWLLGPYITAYARVYKDRTETKDKLRDLLRDIEEHLDEACIGGISEVFDGNWPHKPNGCVSQAWSVAEIIRCYVESI